MAKIAMWLPFDSPWKNGQMHKQLLAFGRPCTYPYRQWTPLDQAGHLQLHAPAPKPVISLHPPWTVVFKGEAVTLTCHVSHFPAAENKKLYQWYLGTEIIREIPGNTLQVRDSGEYRCQTEGSPLSDGVSLIFSSAKLILQAPPSVFEGDSVTLMCRAKAEKVDTAWKTRTLYKNGNVLMDLDENSNFHIEHAGLKDNGEYHCTESETHCCSVSSNTIKIQVQELFPRPVLRANPSLATPGSPVILTCETQLSPQKSDIQLSFHFFRDGHILESSSKSFLKISIPSITGNKDPPYYWCEAWAGTPSVYKQSQKFQIPVQIPVSRPVLTLSTPGARAVEGQRVTLHCEARRGSPRILYQFYHGYVPLWSSSAPSAGGASFSVTLTAEHSGTYSCTADNGFGPQRSDTKSLFVTVPASRPVLTIRTPGTRAVVGDVVELRCEAQRGSPPILYRFYHKDVILGSRRAHSERGASINLSLTAEHSGNYACEADNGLGAQHSEVETLSVTVPASRPVLTLRTPGTRAVVGDMVELRCEAQRGSPPILYRFYHEDVTLGNSSAPSGGGASFNLSLTPEHSGNYACEADNGLGAQRSEAVTLSVTVPASRPVLTLRAPGAQAFPGDVVELLCEAQSGSPPILYRFYHENVTLGSSSAPSGGGVSFNLSLTPEHSGNYACEADNGLGAQRSEAVPLSISGLTGSRSGSLTTGVAGGLLSMVGLVVLAQLLYCRLPRRAGGRPTSDPSRSPSDSDPQEPTYYNVPGWMELQPVYSNVNPKGGDVVYSEVRMIQEGNRHAGKTRELSTSKAPAARSSASTPSAGLGRPDTEPPSHRVAGFLHLRPPALLGSPAPPCPLHSPSPTDGLGRAWGTPALSRLWHSPMSRDMGWHSSSPSISFLLLP
uniref:Fc receptor-like protein 5 isoform X7 n=1 Tax=Halichoerus grypus TaxID=9711 RepID=UPI00165A0062|nr:Fc receptor-like protein 5 isoform X7 [Halichoerus grypus]